MLLNVTDLETGYKNKKVLFGVSLTLEEGEIISILGHNGAGKKHPSAYDFRPVARSMPATWILWAKGSTAAAYGTMPLRAWCWYREATRCLANSQ